MKKCLLILFGLFLFIEGARAQSFQGTVSGSLGILNTKIRIQAELPLNSNASYGLNINYYLVNWRGPILEPFMRIYGKSQGNREGFFGQFKLIYGNLTTLDYELYQNYISNRRWSTFGAGLAGGYKFLIKNKFVIEPLIGFRFLTPPVYNYINGDEYSLGATIGEGAAWYLTTGLPLDFQLKFGYQF